jgi:two-component system, chemotaxis family, CheB/CheR fusion protein
VASKSQATKRKNRPNKAGGAKVARPPARSKNPRASNRSRTSPLIVGLGASAGGLDAFKTFFENMPADSGMAFVLVQHLSPDHKSALADILSKAAAMPVVEAEDGASVTGNHVYVIPPDATLTIKNHKLRVVRPAPPRERRKPIDTFFDSLAEDQGENAVCIILSGTGSDGALGLKAIKESGGLTLAQAGVDHAAMSGMPQSAAATGFVDEVLPVEEMPAKLLHYQRHLRSVASKKDSDGTRGDTAEHLAKISALLRTKLGHDFSKYKEKTMARRIQRRMQVLQIDSVPAYIARLKEEPFQLELLFRELLIGVTEFFRDPNSFAALQSEAIPRLLQNKSPDEQIRIWVPGCATGEEVYSIAILTREAIERHGLSLKVQIFGTDIDEDAVAFARASRYRKTTGLSPERMARWFTDEGEEIRPVNAIREMCVFSTHSVVKDPPFSKLDLVSCRNLLIYMEAELQERILRTFHYSLRPNGILFLGPSEGVTRLARLFASLDKKHRIYRRLEAEVALPELPEAPLPAHDHPKRAAAVPHREDRIDIGARRALEKHSPVYLVIDNHHQIVRFSGGEAGGYLEPSSGLASLNLFGILRKSLRPIVRSALQTARAANEPVVQDDVSIRVEGKNRLLKVIVAPIPEGGAEAGLCVVAFQDTAGRTPDETHEEATENAGAEALKHELHTTKAQLQSTIDELETANEEMKSTTEEYQSVNEELQSSNEELETAKEEMQSVNEELQTINAEMVSKNELLTRLNSDLRNLLDSTDIATIFLDNDLRIKSFTAGMTDIFRLRDADRGRPVTDITTLLSYPDFHKDATKVVRSLTVIEKEVSLADEGMIFLMRIRPYRTVESVIDGVVITFVDITEREKATRALRASEQRLAAIVNQATVGVAETDLNGRFVLANSRYCAMVGRSADELYDLRMHDITHPEDWPRNLEALCRLTGEGKSFEIEKRYVRPDGSIVWAHSNVAAVSGPDGKPQRTVTVSLDITERKRADDHRQLMVQELNHRVKNTLATVQSIAMQTLSHARDTTVAREQFDSRLMALSKAHDILTQESWEGAPLRQIINEAAAPHSALARDRFDIEGPEVWLTPKRALALALALHELCTNAMKYGALSNDEARVRIEWTVANTDGARELRMHWTEMDGPRVTPPRKRGFGSRLIEHGLGQDLGGEVRIDFAATGVTCSISAPLENTWGS